MWIWVILGFLGFLGFVALVIILIRLMYRWPWAGFGQVTHKKGDDEEIQPKKLLWDWLSLLIIPGFLTFLSVVVGILFAYEQGERQQAIDARQKNIENQRAQSLALEGYFDQIGRLLLDDKNPLREPHEGETARSETVRELARARTITILDMLSPERNTRVLEFLFETGLIQTDPPDQKEPIVSLKFADLHKALLVKRHLLQSADLEHADLSKAHLYGADLSNANLHRADLRKAKLIRSDLTNANLSNAKLDKANLREADLRGAKVTQEQLKKVESLKGATMPNGHKHDE